MQVVEGINDYFGATMTKADLAGLTINIASHGDILRDPKLTGVIAEHLNCSDRTVQRAKKEFLGYRESPPSPSEMAAESSTSSSSFLHHVECISSDSCPDAARTAADAPTPSSGSSHDSRPVVILYSHDSCRRNQLANIQRNHWPPVRRRGRPGRRTLEQILQAGEANDHVMRGVWEYLNNFTNVRSGSDGIRHLRHGTWREAYQHYLAEIGQMGYRPITQNGFIRVCRRWHIRLFRHDRYACPICEDVRMSQISEDDPGYRAHRSRVDGMQIVHQRCRQLLKDLTYVIIIADYCRHHDVAAISIDSHERQVKDPSKYKKKTAKTSILSFTVITSPEKGTTCTDQHFDVMGQVKQGPAFMKYGLEELRKWLEENMSERKNILFWADGGLRTWGTIQLLSELSSHWDSVTIRAHYFASYHGHNPCDAHFGQIKTLAKHLGKQGMLQPDDIEKIIRSLDRTTLRLIDSRIDPLVPTLIVKGLCLSHFQTFHINRTGSDVNLKCFETDDQDEKSSTTYATNAENGTNTRNRNISVKDVDPIDNDGADEEDDDFYDDGEEDNYDDLGEDSDAEHEAVQRMIEVANSSTSTFLRSDNGEIATFARKRAQIELKQHLELAATMAKKNDVHFYLVTYVTNQSILNSILQLWIDKCGTKHKERESRAFIDAALTLLESTLPT